MEDKSLRLIAQQLRLAVSPAAETPDAQLLQTFTHTRDEGAFTSLVRRHGSLVLAVARRVLGNRHDAEDVFQATFLVLARKAATVRKHDSLSSWLYCVAFRIAQEMRAKNGRRRTRERQTSEMTTTTRMEEPDLIPNVHAAVSLEQYELEQALAEEVTRLPEKLRLPVVLCYFEGRSSDQAAQCLGCPAITVRTRLMRARDQLRHRLTRRGLVLASGALAALLARQTIQASVSLGLMRITSRAAVQYASGETVRGVSTWVVVLAESCLRGLGLARFKRLILITLLVSFLCAGAVGVAYPLREKRSPPNAQAIALEAPPPQEPVLPLAPALPPGAVRRIGRPRLGAVNALLFTPDGKRIATVEASGRVVLWDASTQQEIGVCANDPGGLRTAVFGPGGAALATGAKNGMVRLWDVPTGHERAASSGHREIVTALAFAPNGKVIASGSRDQSIRLWDTATGKERILASGNQGTIRTLAFSADGKLLASSSEDQTVRVWDEATGREAQCLRDFDSPVEALAFAPDGRHLAVSDASGQVHVRDLDGGPELRLGNSRRPLQGTAATLAFSADGRELSAWSRSDGKAHRWELANGEEKQFDVANTVLSEPCTAWSPDGKTLAWSPGAAGFRLWDTTTGQERWPAATQRTPADRMAFAPDGQTLATADGPVIHLWGQTGQEQHILPGHANGVDALAFAPDGKSLASASSGTNGSLRLWNLTTGAVIWSLPLPSCTIESLTFAPDGKALAWSQSSSQPVSQVDTATGKEIHHFESDKSLHEVRLLLFAADGQSLTGAGSDNTVRVWDVASGQLQHTYQGHSTSLPVLAIAPDGKSVASGSKVLELRDVLTARLRHRCTGHAGEITAIAFSPSGKIVASGGVDGTVRLWDVATGQELRRHIGPPGPVVSLAFAPDGQALASAASDTTVLIWRYTEPGP